MFKLSIVHFIIARRWNNSIDDADGDDDDADDYDDFDDLNDDGEPDIYIKNISTEAIFFRIC